MFSLELDSPNGTAKMTNTATGEVATYKCDDRMPYDLGVIRAWVEANAAVTVARLGANLSGYAGDWKLPATE